MDPVTTAIVAAVLAEADEDELLEDDDKEEIVDAYDDLVVILEEEYASDSKLIEAIYQLEDEDTAAHRQTVHQEVKIAQADRNPAIVQMAQTLLDTISRQPNGDQIILMARTWREL
jgi:hypothetical protein